MRKLCLAGLLAFAASCAVLGAWAQNGQGGNGDKQGQNGHGSVNATEMSALGLLAASAVGTSIYLVRRAKRAK